MSDDQMDGTTDVEGDTGTAGTPEGPLGANYWKLWVASVVSNLGDGLSLIAYPWLASALTRDPVAIAGVVVAGRLPWLLFTLPAGVVTDRVDRRKLIVAMDAVRTLFTLAVAVVVFVGEDSLNDPTDVADGLASTPSAATLALVGVYAASLLLGTAEVFRDNAAQTLMPALVRRPQLERANGRLFGAEIVMNQFVGPPLAGLLLAAGFAAPFFIDAGTFAVSTALIFLIGGTFRAATSPDRGATEAAPTTRPGWRTDLAEGVNWLRRHSLLRSIALSLGALNFLGMVTGATLVLLAQEVLDLGATGFGVLTISGAVGGVAGSATAATLSERIGPGACLFITIVVSALGALAIVVLPNVAVVFVAMAAYGYVAVLWNVITVALRQTIIPDHLLGRVNSVYRFVGWGVIPLGGLAGGVLVSVVDTAFARDTALLAPWLASAVGHALLLVYALPRLTTPKIEAAKAAVGD